MSLELPAPFREDLSSRRGPALFVTRNNVTLTPRLLESSPVLEWTVFTKQDLQGWGPRQLLRLMRSRAWEVMVIEDQAGDVTRRRDLYRGILLCGRGRSRWILATEGERISARRVGLGEWPALLGSLLAEVWAGLAAVLSARRLTGRLARARPRSGPEPPVGNNRVALLRTHFWFGQTAGGSVSHALGVVHAMRDLGLEPRLWTASRLPEADSVLPQAEVRPESRPALVEEMALAGYNRTLLSRIAEDVRRFDPAVIYHRHDAFNLTGLALARRLGIPLVLEVNSSEVWVREVWRAVPFSDLARRMERVAFENADRIVPVSEELARTVIQLGGTRDRVVVNPNGVDLRHYDPEDRGVPIRNELGIPEDAILCGYVGTFTRWSGALFLGECIGRLIRENPRLHFLFIGDGDLRPQTESLLQGQGVVSHTRFTGLVPREEVPHHLAACDILLSPYTSFEDGTEFFLSPTKLFEYMAAGRPVVASRLGQIPAVMEEGAAGVLYEPGDAGAFASAVLRLAGDPAESARMGARGREIVAARYTWEDNVRRSLQGLIELPPEKPGTDSARGGESRQ